MASAYEDLFRRYFSEGTNKGDLSVIDDVFAEDYVHHDPANPDGPVRGREGVVNHVNTLRGAFPDIEFDVEQMVVDGDKICIRWVAHVTHTGDYFGIPPTGKSADITGMNTWHMRDGKAVEGWVNRDDFGLLQQLGIIPSQ